MKVSICYLIVIAIWSTTPLGIVWSSESVSPTMAVMLRMIIAAVLGTAILVILRIKLPVSNTAFRLYGYSTLGLFGGMTCGYMASTYVTSGFMSLVFGLSPIFTGLLARRILDEPAFDNSKKLAMVVCLAGLAIVC